MAKSNERHVRLFRNGVNQAVRIPVEFEMDGDEAILRKEGNRLILEPVKNLSFEDLLDSWEPLGERFPSVDDDAPTDEPAFGS